MALPILDGNQSATTLSTILSSGQHITAHTVVSLGTQAITDISGAVSGSVVSISNLPSTQTIAGTVTANNSVLSDVLEYDGSNFFLAVGGRTSGENTNFPINISGTVTANPTGTQTIAGTVTANLSTAAFIQSQGGIASDNGGDEPSYGVQLGYYDESYKTVNSSRPLPISGTVTVGNTVTIAGTVTANPTGTQTIAGSVTIGAGTSQIGSVTASISNSVTIASLPAISGAVTANGFDFNNSNYSPIPLAPFDENTGGGLAVVAKIVDDGGAGLNFSIGVPISGTVTANVESSSLLTALDNYAANFGDPLPCRVFNLDGAVLASNPLAISGTVTVGNTVTIAGTVTANPTGTQTIAGSVTLGASTAQIGSVTASISNSVVTFYPMQGTSVSNTNFTSTTASTTLVSAVANREVLTVFNEGAGNLHISPGATCTTISYQVRLSAGDYWECPAGQLSLAHTAVFATAGTARVCQVS